MVSINSTCAEPRKKSRAKSLFISFGYVVFLSNRLNTCCLQSMARISFTSTGTESKNGHLCRLLAVAKTLL